MVRAVAGIAMICIGFTFIVTGIERVSLGFVALGCGVAAAGGMLMLRK